MIFWGTLILLAVMTILLVFEVADMALVMFGTLVVFMISGILSPAETFSGFSNSGTVSIGLLYILAYALQSTGLLNNVSNKLLGEPDESDRLRLFRLLFSVASASTIVNNTPIVSMMIPIVKRWCHRHHLAPSRILLLLSYATILGGMCTLIGTSTNLVVHGMLISHGYPGFGFFELGMVGIPLTFLGILLSVFLLHRLLPERKEAIISLGESTREFVVAMKVANSYKHLNKSVHEAGLRHLNGLFLFQIERDGNIITPVAPSDKIHLRDRLFFTGVPMTIVDLQKEPGLEVIEDVVFDVKNYDSNRYRTFEVVISNSSPLVGQGVRESNFRHRFEAVILGIHRNGHRINKKIGDIILQEGDTLLILAPASFHEQWYHSKEFLLVSNSEQIPSRSKIHTYIILGIFVLMIIAVVTRFMPMIAAAATAVTLLFITKSVSPQEALSAVNWKVLLIIAAALGIGQAVDNAGVAQWVAHAIEIVAGTGDSIMLIALVMLLTMLYSEMISNTAAAAIFFPVVLSISGGDVHHLMPLAFAVVIGASASFMTPIGYQTNLMVYGPGGYQFSDYIKAGLPLSLLVWLGGTFIIHMIFFGL